MTNCDHQQSSEHDHPPDIYDLFCHYNTLYFGDALGACVVSWSSSTFQMPPSCAGDCDYFPGGGCEILLSEFVLKPRPLADIKNTLLHEMIHAFLWITKKNNDHSDHGTSFQALAKMINTNVVRDSQRPIGGYNISLSHELLHNVHDCEANHGMCESCGGMENNISANNSEGNQGYTANNASYPVHEGKKLCPNCFVKLEEAEHSRSCSKGEQELDEPMSEGLQQLAGVRRKRICRRHGTAKLNDKDNMVGKSLETFLGVPGSSNSDASFNVDSKEVNICSKEVDLEALQKLEIASAHTAATQEVPKRERTPNRMKLLETCLKKRKLGKSSGAPTVIIAWLNFFADEESDEDSEPLLNKRSERRKRQKLLSLMDGITSSNAVDEASTSPLGSSTDGQDEFSGTILLEHKHENKLHAYSTRAINEVDIEYQKIKTGAYVEGIRQLDVPDAQAGEISFGNKGIQYGSCQITSPLNSPVRDDIVDVSDG